MCKTRLFWCLKSFSCPQTLGILLWLCTITIALHHRVNSRVYYIGLLRSLSKIIHVSYLAHGLAHLLYAINVTFRRSCGNAGIYSDGSRSSGGGGRSICYCFNSNEGLITNTKIHETNCPTGNINFFTAVLLTKFEINLFSFKYSTWKWIVTNKGTGNLY